ncbi:MAG TPA: hypothetical protein VMR28_02465 [Candidatus Saccharimonadales bacterium]|nr:hypothetical protein [Candidatus Saccharimonadales bacterium]
MIASKELTDAAKKLDVTAIEFISSFKKLLKKHPVLKVLLIYILPFFIYLVFSKLFFGPPTFSDFTKESLIPSPDTQIIIWSLHWWPFAIFHHLNPFVSKYIWSPQGFNLAWATAVPTLSFILAPITLTSNAVISYNILTFAAPALSALACFYLVYFITKKYFPSILAGYIFGFSSYQISQMEGHASLYVTFLIPLLVLVFLLRFRGKLSRTIFVILSAILIVLQFGISNEVLASFMIFSFLALLLFYYFSDKKARKLLLSTAIEFYGSFIIALVILSPYLYYMAVGLSGVPATINSPTNFSTDLLNYVIPTPVTYYGSSLTSNIADHFTADFAESGSYIGIPFLSILIYFAIKHWKKKYVKALVGILLATMLLSLGPKLHIDGILHNKALLPWALAAHMPLLKSALPVRFSLYIFLVIAIIVGLLLSYKTSRIMTLIKFAVVIVAIVSIAPRASIFQWNQLPTPKVFSAKYAIDYIPNGSDVIILPFAYQGNSLYYQYTSGMEFTQTGGYIGFIPPDQLSNPVIYSFYTNVLPPDYTQQLAAYCHDNHVAEIIYANNTSPVLIRAINNLGWKEQVVQNQVIVKVPPSLRLSSH